MNIQDTTLARAKKLLPSAPDGPPCFERRQMSYIIKRFEGTSGPPAPDGVEPDAMDVPILLARLRALVKDVQNRNKGGSR